ncbi:hypothetical protein NXX35_06250 [Bacteroides xylanisolvens]|nr:hypothetical protein NXX35_06250 [Bacteroides xylanisolvens]
MLPDVPVPVVGPSVPEKEADPVISVPVVVPEVIPAPLVRLSPPNQRIKRQFGLNGWMVSLLNLTNLQLWETNRGYILRL